MSLVLASVLLVVVTQVVTYVWMQQPAQPRKPVPIPRIDYKNQFLAAQQQGESYMLSQLASMQPSDQLFLDYLYRTYQAPAAFSAQQTPIIASKERTIPVSEMTAVMKMVYPAQKVSSLPGDASLLALAMQCDVVALPATYNKQLEDAVRAGGYQTTHAIIALKIINELNCKTGVDTAVLIERSLGECQRIAADGSNIPDLRYEAMAVLALFGKTNLITDEWIARLLREQNSDGGWPYGYDTTASKHHSTMLALWVLYALQNTSPASNWIMAQS